MFKKFIFSMIFIMSVSILNSNAQSNPTIAVLNLDAKGISNTEADILTSRLRASLFKTGKYRVVDRGAQEQVLQEQGFQQTGCISDECVVQAGRLLGVQKMLGGSVGKFGKVYTIELRIINVETAGIEAVVTYDYQGEIEKLLTEGIDRALAKLMNTEYTKPVEFGIVSLQVSPDSAKIIIDNNNYKLAEVKNLKIVSGDHELVVFSPYYYRYNQRFSVLPEKIIPLQIKLKFGGDDLKKIQKQKKWFTISSIIGLGLTLGSVITANYMYDKYENTTSPDDAEKYRRNTETFDKISLSMGCITAGVSILTVWKWIQSIQFKNKLSIP